MNSTTQFLCAAFDESLSHQWESVEDALRGVTDAEAAWQHPSYRDVIEPDRVPPPGTILWQIVHLDQCLRHYRTIMLTRPRDDAFDTPPPPLGSLQSHITSLHEAAAALRRTFEVLTEDDLAAPCRRGMSVGEFIRMITRHNSWHAGQIKTIRRVYAHAVK